MIQLIYAVFKCPNCGHNHNPIQCGTEDGNPTVAVLLKIDCENCHQEYNLSIQALIATFPKDKENNNFLHDINILDEEDQLDI